MNDDVENVEKYVDFLTNCLRENNSGNIRKTEDIKSGYQDKKVEVGFNHYIRSGDTHYFVARVLFLSGVCEYSFFAAQQCVELYLKGYIKYKGGIPPDDHVLPKLVTECKKVSQGDEFIKSDRLVTISERFNPFYEYPRYPIQRNRPQDGAYAFLYPDDIKPLDYFVYKMRELIEYPENSYDMLKEGKLPGSGIVEGENAEVLFKRDNINFTSSKKTTAELEPQKE